MSIRALIRTEFQRLYLDDHLHTRLDTITDILQNIRDSAIPIQNARPRREQQENFVPPPEVEPHPVAAYNIIPFDDVVNNINDITSFPEVRAAKSSLKYEDLPNLPANFRTRVTDVLDFLHCIFGFQKGNVLNQRENIVNLLSNEQNRVYIPDDENDPQLDSDAVKNVFSKCLDNYIEWCNYLDTRPMWSNFGSDIPTKRRILYISLYFLIWGEAANVRFLPECLCYIFHRMGDDLNSKLEQLEQHNENLTLVDENGVDSFLNIVISPIYNVIAEEARKIKEDKVPHSSWGNYDDFNEYFWSPRCLNLVWPLNITSPLPLETSQSSRLQHMLDISPRKNSFVEHRTFLRLYHSFNRLWIFLSLTFQGLAIIAFNDGKLNSKTLFQIFSLGPTFFAMKTFQSGLDIFMSSTFSTTNLLDIYVGRDMKESKTDKLMYMSFWLVVLALKFSFAYFLQIRPLVEPTWKIIDNKGFLPTIKDTHNVLVLASLWAPAFIMYLLDVYIFYTIISAFVGFYRGKKDRLGEIKSLADFRKRFHEFPGKFMDKLHITLSERHSDEKTDLAKKKFDAAKFVPFWNEIVKNLVEEDYISPREMEWLEMPKRNVDVNVDVVQWPVFLLGNKIFRARDIAGEGDTQENVWARISEDIYMKYAVEECFYTLELILTSVWDDDGMLWVGKIYQEIRRSIESRNIYSDFQMENLKFVIKRVTALVSAVLRDIIRYNLHLNTPAHEQPLKTVALDLYDFIRSKFFRNHLRWPEFDVNRLFSNFRGVIHPELRAQAKRLLTLLTIGYSPIHIPQNAEARRRLEFFTNSLFMEMPKTEPVRKMLPFSVFTPYYGETVIYSQKELFDFNEDGVSILYNLKTIYPDEWQNFIARIGRGEIIDESNLINNEDQKLELRLWASYRGQTLARTVRGMMYNRKALMLQSYLERTTSGDMDAAASDNEANAIADLKFTYVVSCQKYGQQRKDGLAQAADIALLLQKNDALRVAFIDETVTADGMKEYFSKLVKGDGLNRIEKEVYSIKLPGNPILGEGKPENQNHAIIFTRGNALQTVDMNQDNYFEEALKMRNLLEEFHVDHGTILGVREHVSSGSVSSLASFTSKMKNHLQQFLANQKIRPTILGVREHVFTESVSSLASFMSNQETSFVTLGQRVLANPLKVRMHYGHPDVFDRVFHITRGGISKASPVINISEDIYAGFNSTLRNGNITHHEYIQVGKGRDVGLNQIALFEGKVAGGNGEQVLSRDVYRLGHLFDFFRMLSFYFTTVGYYFCSMLTVVTVYLLLYRKLYLALFETRADVLDNSALNTPFGLMFLIQIVFLTALPMFFGDCLEKGFKKALESFKMMQCKLCTLFFTFSLGTRAHYFGRTILHGGAKYHATGRGFAVQHIRISENYRLYSRSHFVKGFEVVLLLSVYRLDGLIVKEAGSLGNILTYGSWFMAISWIIAPLLFNPSSFEWGEIKNNLKDWKDWTFTAGGTRRDGTPVPPKESWEPWWNEEVSHIRTLEGRVMETILSLRFFIFQYGVVKNKWDLQGSNMSLLNYVYSWPVLISFLFALELADRCYLIITNKIFSSSSRQEIRVQSFRYFLLEIVGIATVGLFILPIIDKKAFILAFISTGWGIVSICVAWKSKLEKMGLSKSVASLAWLYDLGMGGLILLVQIICKLIHMDSIQHLISTNPEFSLGLQMRRFVLSR